MRIGTARFCAALCGMPCPIDVDGVLLADEHGWLAAFELAQEMRPEAAFVVNALKARRLRIHLASGDTPAVVAAMARDLGIDAHAGAMSPQDKLAYVARLQDEGRVVVMVGDGLNDAPVLAGADASFALGSGAEAAQLQADVVLVHGALAGILHTMEVARRALRLVRQNIAWALAYNALAIPAAALGWIGPWEAALAMGASSLTVLANALRPLQPEKSWKASTSSFPSPSPSYS